MDLKIKLAGITFENPIWVASGTFGTKGQEFEDFIDFAQVGAIVTKTVTLLPREGNPPPRVVETRSGLLNSIGLPNKGINSFVSKELPELKKMPTKIIVSIAGTSLKDIEKMIKKIPENIMPDAIELNLSCPNVTHGKTKYKLTAQDPQATEKMVKIAVGTAKCPIIAKLTPNVTDITEIAKAAKKAGAQAVSLVNTYAGIAIDVEEMKPVLGNVVGGLSGPAIKPLALKAVRDVYNSVDIPIVGIGGIVGGVDVAEFMLCGARAVQVGTANLIDPDAHKRISKEFEKYLILKGIKKASGLTGKLKGGRTA